MTLTVHAWSWSGQDSPDLLRKWAAKTNNFYPIWTCCWFLGNNFTMKASLCGDRILCLNKQAFYRHRNVVLFVCFLLPHDIRWHTGAVKGCFWFSPGLPSHSKSIINKQHGAVVPHHIKAAVWLEKGPRMWPFLPSTKWDLKVGCSKRWDYCKAWKQQSWRKVIVFFMGMENREKAMWVQPQSHSLFVAALLRQ